MAQMNFNEEHKDPRRGTGQSIQSLVHTEDDSIDFDQLEDTIMSFSQDLLQIAASRSNLSSFKGVGSTMKACANLAGHFRSPKT